MKGGEGQVKGKLPCVENPSSSALKSTVIVDGVLYHFSFRSSESTDSLAPKSSHYVDLSAYPPGTDIEHELHWDGRRPICKVPIWAHEKWLLNHQNPDGTITTGGRCPLSDLPNPASPTAASGTKALKRPGENLVEHHSSAAHGGKGPLLDHPNSASATAASGTKAIKRSWKELVENHPSATAAAHGAETEVGGLNSYAYPYAYPAPNASQYQDFAGKYRIVVEKDGRIVRQLDKWATPKIRYGRAVPCNVIGGISYHPDQALKFTK